MEERELRRRCKRELRSLKIEPPLRVDVLCERFGESRGRPIRLVPYALPIPGPFGLWLSTATTDYLVYQAGTSRIHQDHIILHEFGHMMADHVSDEEDDQFWRTELPDLSPDMIRRALRRTSYDDRHECEAELVATIVMEWASDLDYTTPHRSDQKAARQLEGAFSERQGWL
ncbi:hypothetical protein [Pseudonocardia spinosispora]|uniref:hypothetical protein n=1 Tax=Pseudonocardia spinosispora TaxID=103441 RepID=UPI00041587DE|nr:hypothetical protein [Pseudonocardia spinosispora]